MKIEDVQFHLNVILTLIEIYELNLNVQRNIVFCEITELTGILPGQKATAASSDATSPYEHFSAFLLFLLLSPSRTLLVIIALIVYVEESCLMLNLRSRNHLVAWDNKRGLEKMRTNKKQNTSPH